MTDKKTNIVIGLTGVAGSGKDTVAKMMTRWLFKNRIATPEAYAFAKPLKEFIEEALYVPFENLNDRKLKEEPITIKVRLAKIKNELSYFIAMNGYHLSGYDYSFSGIESQIYGEPISNGDFYEWMLNRFIETLQSEIVPFTFWERLFKKDKDHIMLHTTGRRLAQLIGTDFFRHVVGPNIWCDLAPKYDVIFTDVRFPNEAKHVTDNGGVVIGVINRNITSGTSSSHVSESSVSEIKPSFVIDNSGTSLAQLEAEVNKLMEYLYAK